MEQETEIRLLKHLVQTPSVTGSEHMIGQVVQAEMEKAGLYTTVYQLSDERPLVLGVLEGKKAGPVLLFNGHTDTHPVADYDGNPFDSYTEAGKLYGRGSVDMKGGLAAMICAGARLVSKKENLLGTLIIAAVPDEELLSEGSTFLSELGICADAGVVGEPTGLHIGRAMRGVTHIDIRITGIPKHTSGWNQDGNAIVQMGHALVDLDRKLSARYRERGHVLLGIPLFNIGLIRGGERPNVVAQECVVTMLRRDISGEDMEAVFAEIKELVSDIISDSCSVEVYESKIQKRSGNRRRLPMEVSEDSSVVQALKCAVKKITKEDAKIGMVPFWCDASILTNEAGIPTVVFGPGDISCAHSVKEWIDLEQYTKAISIYEQMAWDFLSEGKIEKGEL